MNTAQSIKPARSLKLQMARLSTILFWSIALLLFPNKGMATNATWVGGASDNTDNAANWLGGTLYPKDFGIVTFDVNTTNSNMTINEYPFFTGGLTLSSNLTHNIAINGLTLFTGDADIDMSAAGADLTVNSSLAMYGAAHPSVWNVGTGRTLTFNGIVSDSSGAGYHKSGAGTVWLNAANTNTGGTTINGGAIVATNADSLGNGDVVINNSGTLYINQQWVLHGLNPYTNPTGTTPGVTNVTVNAGGQLALDPTNGFANGVTNLYLNGGSVTGGNTGSSYGGIFLYNGNQQITAGNATTSTISTSIGLTGNNNTITVGASSALNITNVLKDGQWGAGGFIKAGSGTVTLSGANTYTGTTTISGGTLEIGGAGTLGNGSYAGDISIAGALVYNSSANQDLTGIITGSGSITKSGSGTLTLTQATGAYPVHLFDGAITINSGTLVAADVGFGLNFTSSITVNGGILNVQTQPSEQGNLYLNGGTVTSTGLANATYGNILLSQNSTAVHAGGAAVSTISVNQVNLWGTNSIDVGAGSTLNLTSVVAEYGPASLNKTGAGTLALSGANTYSGVTSLAGGVLNVASLSDYGVAGGLGNRAAVADAPGIVGILFQGGTLQYTGSTAQSTNRGIRISTTGGGGTIDASGSNSGATLSFTATSSPDFFENGGNRTLTLTGSNTGANTFAMAIGDAIGTTSFVKSGAGQWVLTGANTYSGATTVNAGTLLLGQGGSLSPSTAVSVTGTATLGTSYTTSSNTIAGGSSLTMGSGTFLNLQDTKINTLNYASTGSLTGSNLWFDLGTAGASDQLTLQSTATLSGAQTFAFALATGVTSLSTAPNAYTLVTAASGLDSGGTFALSSSTIVAGSKTYTLTLGNSATAETLTANTTPFAPTISGITPGNTQLSVAYVAGADGGSAITNYKYSLNGGSFISAGSTANPLVITGLSNGTSYSVVIKAVNALGDGDASNSVSGTPVGSAYQTWATSAPNNLTIPGNGDKTADPDGDGRINLLEFATNDNPNSGNASGKQKGAIGTVSGQQVLTLTVPVRSGATFSGTFDQASAAIDGVIYTIQGTTDLTAGFTNLVQVSEVSGGDATAIQNGMPTLDSGWTYRTFRATGYTINSNPVFLRLKVTASP